MPEQTVDNGLVWGVDFGAKLAGTTVIASINEKHEVQFTQSERKRDADRFLREEVQRQGPQMIFIDAPLSLPLACRETHPHEPGDFFYRACDREIKAMSPLFLGGLTARAMNFASHCAQDRISVRETYPAGLARLMNWPDRPLQIVADWLQSEFRINLSVAPANPHQFDALLALISGLRFSSGVATTLGDEKEGLVIL